MTTNYSESPDRKVYNIDFDGTITFADNNYLDPTPDIEFINKIKDLYYSGHIIIIWTARRWSNATILVSYLIRWDIPFHGVMMGKGGSDYYIDDKAINVKDFT